MLSLEAEKIVQTLEQLQERIADRFPDSGLSRVCRELVTAAHLTADRARAARQPNLLLRITAALVMAGFIYLVIAAGEFLHLTEWFNSGERQDGVELTQALESIVNLFILTGAASWFLLTAEVRLRRHAILKYLHELRSIAHVVDMHQLTKDPAVIVGRAEPTEHSPRRDMTEQELARYLDYCTEMLAIIGKLAALYAERMDDTEVVAAANDLENLTTNLGRKIWQKIMLIGGTSGFTRASS